VSLDLEHYGAVVGDLRLVDDVEPSDDSLI
jgi:hypothetical protein